ncbi:MAG: TIGR01777 family oxidoreductase [Flavobacteriales bacterium]
MKKIIIAGGTGFIGETLIRKFEKSHAVIVLSRKHLMDTKHVKYVKWNGEHILADLSIFEKAEALINLCGKSVNCRYTEENKQEIYDSRIKPSMALGKLINSLTQPPKLWLSTTSSTIYKHSLTKAHTESNHEFGHGFSIDVCHKWEGAINNISTPHTRKVLLRTSIVLGKNGGAMKPLLAVTRLGLGGKQGNGQQKISWIHEGDLANLVAFLIEREDLSGEFNAASTRPETNQQFMRVLRKTWRIPFGLPTPAWMLHVAKLIIGTEPELALKSRFLLPEKAINAGFEFQYSTLQHAFKEIKDRIEPKKEKITDWG